MTTRLHVITCVMNHSAYVRKSQIWRFLKLGEEIGASCSADEVSLELSICSYVAQIGSKRTHVQTKPTFAKQLELRLDTNILEPKIGDKPQSSISIYVSYFILHLQT